MFWAALKRRGGVALVGKTDVLRMQHIEVKSSILLYMEMEENNKAKVAELIDKSEIAHAVNSYFRALDEKNFDSNHFATFLTADAEITRPNGSVLVGPEAISASHTESLSHYESTQHLLTSHDISVSGDTATVRANLVAMHMYEGAKQDANKADNFFVAGGVVTAELARLDDQWKIVQTRNDVVWRAGNGAKLLALFQNMTQDNQSS